MATALAPPPVPSATPGASVRLESDRHGEIARIVIGGGPGNPLGIESVIALQELLAGLRKRHEVKLLVFQGEGADFSAGVPLAELVPENIARFLPAFHHLAREIEDIGIPTAALVRGRCHGAGFELVSLCGTVLCDATARFASTAVALGGVPALAALALPWRVGGARAAELLLTGRTIGGAEAVACGLADRQAQDLDAALHLFFDDHLAGRSALVLRYVWRAVRRPIATALERELPLLEETVLDDLLLHRDAQEALRAALEARLPDFTHA